MAHTYRVTVERLDAAAATEPVVFTARSHDDIATIVGRARSRGDLDADEAASMAVGLKLLGGVVLAHRKEPLFTDIGAALGAFIGRLKQR